MVTILKLGGSVITEKDQPETVDTAALADAVETIATAHTGENSLVLVHGGGSFGHHHAAEHGVSSTTGTHDSEAVSAIHRAMGRLNDAVLDACHEAGIEALPVRPLSAASRSGGALTFPSGQVATMLESGFVPVVHGDVIADAEEGATVLSGDEIVVTLARSLDADHVGLCSTVPGVLDENEEVIGIIDSYDNVADALGGSEATDVTGGMAGKVRTLLELDVPASVFDSEHLEAFLTTGTAGTVIFGDE